MHHIFMVYAFFVHNRIKLIVSVANKAVVYLSILIAR
jgi:hypothetical protein